MFVNSKFMVGVEVDEGKPVCLIDVAQAWAQFSHLDQYFKAKHAAVRLASMKAKFPEELSSELRRYKGRLANHDDFAAYQLALKKIEHQLRLAARSQMNGVGLRVQSYSTGILVHDFLNGFTRDHVIDFDELVGWGVSQGVFFERWPKMDAAAAFGRCCDVLGGLHLWEPLNKLVLRSGVVVSLQDLNPPLSRWKTWVRRFLRQRDFRSHGGFISRKICGYCTDGPRGVLAELSRQAAARGEKMANHKDYLTDLIELQKLIEQSRFRECK